MHFGSLLPPGIGAPSPPISLVLNERERMALFVSLSPWPGIITPGNAGQALG